MRQILFRAKRKDNGEWVEGAYFCLHHNDERKHLHHFIIPDNTDIPKDKTIGEIQVEVISETVSQCTGLTDKNGCKIWENDIVTIPGENERSVIRWDFEQAAFVIESDTWQCDFDNYRESDLEVIGNVFDNADLLEEQT